MSTGCANCTPYGFQSHSRAADGGDRAISPAACAPVAPPPDAIRDQEGMGNGDVGRYQPVLLIAAVVAVVVAMGLS
jgi:hypothetical protein